MNPAPPRRWLLAAALLLAGCLGLDGPQQIVLTPADLLQAMAPRFPVERRVLGILQVRAELPRLALLADSRRLAAEFDLQVEDRLSRQTYRGVVGFDSQLRYEPSDQSVRLDQLRMQKLQFDGLASQAQPLLQTVGAALAEQLLADVVVYRFPADKLRAAERRGYAPGAVRVGEHGVTIDLLPTSGAR